jgi:hypothetical protein
MKVLKPGDKVPASGIYRVAHLLPHITEERDMYFEGSHFPPCRICAEGVHYRLESPCVPMAATAFAQFATASC